MTPWSLRQQSDSMRKSSWFYLNMCPESSHFSLRLLLSVWPKPLFSLVDYHSAVLIFLTLLPIILYSQHSIQNGFYECMSLLWSKPQKRLSDSEKKPINSLRFLEMCLYMISLPFHLYALLLVQPTPARLVSWATLGIFHFMYPHCVLPCQIIVLSPNFNMAHFLTFFSPCSNVNCFMRNTHVKFQFPLHPCTLLNLFHSIYHLLICYIFIHFYLSAIIYCFHEYRKLCQSFILLWPQNSQYFLKEWINKYWEYQGICTCPLGAGLGSSILILHSREDNR